MDRLATTLTADFERSPVPPGAAVSDYLAALGRAHDVFVDVVADAGSSVAAAPGELGRVVAEQTRLTRQFLDAQRTIVRYWAEVDAEIADLLERARYGSADHVSADHSGQDARIRGDDPAAELRALLDLWWRREHQAGKELIADAGRATRHVSGETMGLAAAWPPPTVPSAPALPTPVADTPASVTCTWIEPTADPLPGQSAAEILSAFVDVRPDALLATIDALLAVLPTDRAAQPLTDRTAPPLTDRAAPPLPPPLLSPFAPPFAPPFPPPALAPAPSPPVDTAAVVDETVHDEPVASGADDDAAFARFWNASRESRRSPRPQVEAVVSLLSMLVVLTAVLAWIG